MALVMLDTGIIDDETRRDLEHLYRMCSTFAATTNLVTIPTAAEQHLAQALAANERSSQAGGLRELFPNGEWPSRLMPALRGLLNAGVGTVDELLDLMGDDDRILSIRGIGVGRRVALLHAMHDYVTTNGQTEGFAAPYDARDGKDAKS